MWIDDVIQDVAELPDRSSPEDWPEAMLVTADELRTILENAMKASEVKCRKCGQDAMQAAERGAYLGRVSPKGEAPVMECVPSCEHKHGDHKDALVHAVQGA